MIQRSESDEAVKQEKTISSSAAKNISKASSSSTSWSKSKDPRIVRVSRAFGGKDRHSKVCTVKGLRDRRVRLSVPTAIQLYDLQDRLGLNQPSKVVDWLLDAAKHEIDELPPLQIPPGFLTQITSFDLDHHHPNPTNFIEFGAANSKSSANAFWERNEAERQLINMENQRAFPNYSQGQSGFVSVSSSGGQYNPFCKWDPSQLTLSQPTRSMVEEDLNSFSFVSMPSALGQVLVHPPEMTSATQSYFPLQMNAHEFNIKQMSSNYQTLVLPDSSLTSRVSSKTTSSQPVRPFHFTMASNQLPSQNSAAADHDDNQHFDFNLR